MKLLPCLLALAFAATLTAAEKLQLTLPPHWHGVAGLPMSVYFDNIVLTETPDDLRVLRAVEVMFLKKSFRLE